MNKIKLQKNNQPKLIVFERWGLLCRVQCKDEPTRWFAQGDGPLVLIVVIVCNG